MFSIRDNYFIHWLIKTQRWLQSDFIDNMFTTRHATPTPYKAAGTGKKKLQYSMQKEDFEHWFCGIFYLCSIKIVLLTRYMTYETSH